MTCNHARENRTDAGVEFFSTPAFRRVSKLANAHKSVKRLHNLTVDATQRNAATSVILLTDLTLDKQEGSRHQTHTPYQDMDYRNTSPILSSRIKPVR